MSHDDALVWQTVRRYEANLTLVESMGRSYGFDPLFYWQPVILSKRYRSSYEQTLARFDIPITIKKTYDAIYRRVRQSESLNSHPHFHDISTLFNDSGEAY